MTRNERLHVRIAAAIHDHVMPKQHATKSIELPAAAWQQCETLLRKMRRASQRDWQFAAGRLRRDLRMALERLHGELLELDRKLERPTEKAQRASMGDIHADLFALHEEFEEVSFDRRGHTISVTTEPIELDSVYLGAFEIRLDWSDLTEGHPYNYRVIALDANPPAANDSVTHPHVQDEAVCEGDGHQPIRKALEQGRLLDFFVIVANLLRTYNSSSPYVSLSDWHGVECTDCGNTVSDDERWTCEKCETMMCGECHYNCPGCDGIYCNECVTRCEGCDEYHCGSCIKNCSRCHAELCQGCLNDNERCSDCHEQKTEEEREELVGVGDSSGDCAIVTPLQPNRLGEVAVPA